MADVISISGLKPFSRVELALIGATMDQTTCDLSATDEDGATALDMAQWGDSRTIRSALLLAVIEPERLDERPDGFRVKPGRRIDLKGAVIAGDCLNLQTNNVGTLELRGCRFDCEVDFTGTSSPVDVDFSGSWFNNSVKMAATRFNMCNFEKTRFLTGAVFAAAKFQRNTNFKDAQFECTAEFEGSECTGQLDFEGCRFTADAEFGDGSIAGDGKFKGATFRGDADFSKHDFKAVGDFSDCVFAQSASFAAAKFGGTALFRGTLLSGASNFNRTRFNAKTHFENTILTGSADFSDAHFGDTFHCLGTVFTEYVTFNRVNADKDVVFNRSTVVKAASFRSAHLKSARFDKTCAETWNFQDARFEGPQIGPWVGRRIDISRTIFLSRCRINMVASRVNATALQAREAIQLQITSDQLNLGESEFLRASDLSPWLTIPDPAKDVRYTPSARLKEVLLAKTSAVDAAMHFRSGLSTTFIDTRLQCRLTSLAQATVAELALSGVALDDCAFGGAHGLDKLRFGADCSFAVIDRWFQGAPTSRRRILAEDLAWRRCFTGPTTRATPTNQILPAFKIASIYRSLRKGLEDSKNEPGAADFYYGEMEMRRLSRRKAPLTPGPQRPEARRNSETSSRVERLLLYLYWAIAGYGLRASRALLALFLVIVFCAFLYTQPALATLAPPSEKVSKVEADGSLTYRPSPPATAPDFPTALEFSLRESVSLLQIGNQKSLDTHGFGVAVEIFLRLAGPALLALALLAIRARTKR